ncbi:ABC transporter substrate-binding protein [Erythrobacter sp. YT30]|uniref:ABC transporter substrate-binding protein n=1 Tax=Erythrobacter sp. YT30 TaxID=1735012 RepID=UPI00076D4BAA|nr:ABC transporter substrate-binding protein [Erythrobacter sp. YT30]KWV91761.1 hypothetical protein AUC45_11190 [Erythrobacter sp. YT30]
MPDLKNSITLTLLAILALLLSGCEDKPSERTTLPYAEFKIALSAMSFLAYNQGYTSENGIDLQPISLEAGPDVVASLSSASERSGVAGNIAIEPVAAMIAAQRDPVVIATVLTSDRHVQLVTFAESGITDDPATLRGKRIGFVANTIGETYLLGLLERAGLSRDDLETLNARPTDLRSALVRGDLDAAILWDPFIQQARRIYNQGIKAGTAEDRGELLALVDPTIFTLRMNVVTTREKLEGSREQLVGLLNALIETEGYIEENRAEAQASVETWLGLEAGDLGDFFSTTSFRVELQETELRDQLQVTVNRLRAANPTSFAPNDYSPFVDSTLLVEIAPDRVSN